MTWSPGPRFICEGPVPSLLAWLVLAWFAGTLSGQDPKLQHREGARAAESSTNTIPRNTVPGNAALENVTPTVTEVKSPLTLPQEAGGEYVFGKPGEFIEIIFQDGVLHGYMSRESISENDRGAPLTYRFLRTTVDGDRIHFATGLIHGAWYSFEGTILRGPSKSLADDGYYRLAGALVLHDEGSHTVQRRTVNLKLSRRM